MAELLLLAVPGLPLLLATALLVPPLRPLAIALAPAAPLPAVAATLALPEPVAFAEPWLLLGSEIGLDATGRSFLLFTGLLWLFAGIAAALYLVRDLDRTGFFACFLLAMAGNLGLIVAADVFSFYAFFAVMSFAAWGLVAHARTPPSRFAARVYVGFVVAGELALFAGLSLAAAAAGSTLLADLRAAPVPGLATGLMIAGFAVKLGLVPLHLWLPLAHAAAPFPASAVLSGAMIKAGLFGMLAVLPLGAAPLVGWGGVLAAAGAASVLVAALVGVTQSDPKAVLAYSSVGQMGLVALGLGTALAAPEAWPAVAPALVFYAALHGLAKGPLFLGVGAHAAAGPRLRPSIWAALLAPAATLAAAPLTSGYPAKSALEEALGAAAAPWAGLIPLAIPIASVATTLLMLRFLVTLRGRPAGAGGAALAVPFLAAAAVATTIAAIWPFPDAPPAAAPGLAAVAPLAAGLALAAAAWAGLAALRLRVAPVPPGEALALLVAAPDAPSWPATAPAPARRRLRPRPDAALARLRALEAWRPGAALAAVALLAIAVAQLL